MVKTTVYLENDLALSLRRLAAAQGRSQAELIRDALHAYSTQHTKPLERGFGKYASGVDDTSERADDILMEAAKRAVNLTITPIVE